MRFLTQVSRFNRDFFRRQLALSQQRMDDRRRKKMNSEYNRGTTETRIGDDDDT